MPKQSAVTDVIQYPYRVVVVVVVVEGEEGDFG